MVRGNTSTIYNVVPAELTTFPMKVQSLFLNRDLRKYTGPRKMMEILGLLYSRKGLFQLPKHQDSSINLEDGVIWQAQIISCSHSSTNVPRSHYCASQNLDNNRYCKDLDLRDMKDARIMW